MLTLIPLCFDTIPILNTNPILRIITYIIIITTFNLVLQILSFFRKIMIQINTFNTQF